MHKTNMQKWIEYGQKATISRKYVCISSFKTMTIADHSKKKLKYCWVVQTWSYAELHTTTKSAKYSVIHREGCGRWGHTGDLNKTIRSTALGHSFT